MSPPPLGIAELRAVQARYPRRSVAISGRDWRWRDTGGEGPALVLLPGGLGTSDLFYRQLTMLGPVVRCIAVDYPDAPPTDLADGLADLLHGFDVDPPCIVGASFAGYWLQLFGARHHGAIGALVLANAFSNSATLRLHPLFDATRLELVDGEELKEEWLAALERCPPDELRDAQLVTLREGQAGELLRRRLLAAATATPAPQMPTDGAPIFILDCADDPILDEATREKASRRYPAAVRRTLDTGGHYPAISRADAFDQFLVEAASCS